MASVPCAVPDTVDRVLIVDDSVVVRTVIARAIDADERFAVVGSVATSAAALAFLARGDVELIVLDIAMPGVDGLTALPDLIAAGRGAKVLVVSSSADAGGAASIDALSLGAADTLVKPRTDALAGKFGAALVEKLVAMSAAAPVVRAVPAAAVPSVEPYDVIAIGASTGGIHALSLVLRALPPGFRQPIVVTQHLPASFINYFATQLAVLGGRPCDVATDRMRLRPGRIVVAPGDAHVTFTALPDGTAAIRLVRHAVPSGCMPSVDPMFESLAQVFGMRGLAVVLSGMGRDGADGARRVFECGGAVVVQDRATSVVWGMPGAVACAGHAHAVLDPDEIGRLIADRRRAA